MVPLQANLAVKQLRLAERKSPIIWFQGGAFVFCYKSKYLFLWGFRRDLFHAVVACFEKMWYKMWDRKRGFAV